MCASALAEPAIWRNSVSKALWRADAHTFFNGVPVLSASAAVHADTTTPSFSTVDMSKVDLRPMGHCGSLRGHWTRFDSGAAPPLITVGVQGCGTSAVCAAEARGRTSRGRGRRAFCVGRRACRCTTIFFDVLPSATLKRDDGLQGRAPRGSHRRLPIFHGLLRGHARLQQARPAPHPRHPDHGERACQLRKRGLTHCSARMYVYALSRPELSAHVLPSYRTRRSS